MLEKVKELEQQIKDYPIENEAQLEEFRLAFLKREIPALMGNIKEVAPEDRKDFGIALNALKELTQSKFKEVQAQLEAQKEGLSQSHDLDLTLPVIPHQLGSIHPLTIVKNRIIEIFERIGFNVADGPEIEDDWHNFTSLNFPPNHPAREMQDTFFLEKNPDIALRTHTSSVQVRLMEKQKPPIRSIMPGRVFRNEAISARAHCIFHQVEGLFIDENVSLLDLKQTLYHFAKEMFGKHTKVRFRPSFFPFTEPSAEIDISCGLHEPGVCKLCGGAKNICKGTGWVEIGGSGMVDPNVLANCGIDPEKYTGFAFGMGIERITMLKYQIKDLRLFTENDIRFLRQFGDIAY
ncbi:MAG: phenylalanine--tRNA ligase subunit alpha [Microscillaceae bacterium]|nr:phenylalanine--tRNA ligase subunit alpha [Microscillaceae bacterium]